MRWLPQRFFGLPAAALPASLLAFAGLLSLSACQGTEDYLADLYTIQASADGKLPLEMYDAGQVAHEAFSGLVGQDAMTLSQLGRAVAYAGRAVDASEVSLLRSQALTLLVRLTLNYPLPPVAHKLEDVDDRRRKILLHKILEQISIMTRSISRLAVGSTLLPALDSPDRATVVRAFRDLEDLTGQKFGRDAEQWRAWWAQGETAFKRQVAQDVREPLRILSGIRLPTLKMTELTLTMLAAPQGLMDLESLRSELKPAIQETARQVVELAIIKALTTDTSPLVRGQAALAAAQIRAPEFAGPLVQASIAERDPDARIRMVRALVWYPGKPTMMALLLSLQSEDAALAHAAVSVLAQLAERQVGKTFEEWMVWWRREGEHRWP